MLVRRVSPGLCVGSGLKHHLFHWRARPTRFSRPLRRERIETIDVGFDPRVHGVSPGLCVGSGLKPRLTEGASMTAVVSPGLCVGSGLKP